MRLDDFNVSSIKTANILGIFVTSVQIEIDDRTSFGGLRWPIRFHNFTKTLEDIFRYFDTLKATQTGWTVPRVCDQNNNQALIKDRQNAERNYKSFCRFDSLCVACEQLLNFMLYFLWLFYYIILVSVDYTLFGFPVEVL